MNTKLYLISQVNIVESKFQSQPHTSVYCTNVKILEQSNSKLTKNNLKSPDQRYPSRSRLIVAYISSFPTTLPLLNPVRILIDACVVFF